MLKEITASDILADLKDNKIELVYQPIYDIQTEKIIAYEALTRWEKDNKAIYNPETLFSLVEDYQLIEVTNYLAEQAATDQLLLKKKVHYNLCYFQLFYPLVHSNLCYEITEKVISDNAINRIKRICQSSNVWIDDCFSDYSALKWIPELNLKGVKIDKFIIDRIDQWAYQLGLYYFNRYITGLGLLTCCEGVETKQQYQMVKQLGVKQSQGYYLARPQSIKYWLNNC